MSLRFAAFLAGLLVVVGVSTSQGALINSWENDTEGWNIYQNDPNQYASAGFSTTTGVTDQTYSWVISGGPHGPNYSAFFGGPALLSNTTILSTAKTIAIDVTIPTGGDFGWFQQWSAVVNNADTGYVSLDGYTYTQSPGIGSTTPSTLSWDIPAGIRSTLASSASPTEVVFQIGGGTNGGTNNTMYVDNLRTTEIPEPATLALAALFGFGLMSRRYI